MAKFYGLIGYAETVESSPGVWSDVITKKELHRRHYQEHQESSSSRDLER